MAIQYAFDGTTIIQPGAYAQTQGGLPENFVAAEFGGVLAIDTGSGANYGGGSGILGELQQGKDSVYRFAGSTMLDNFRAWIRGGLWWDLSGYMVNPLGSAPGVSSITFVKAAKTTAGNIHFAYSGGAGVGAKATARIGIVSASIFTPGSGYTDGTYTVDVVGGQSDTAGQIEVEVVGGVVTAVNSIVTVGEYTFAPENPVQVTGLPGGSGAQFTLDFGVTSVVVDAGGSGYGTAPDVVFQGGGDSIVTEATATSTLTVDAVTSITIGVNGSGYTVAPVVYIVDTTNNGGYVLIKTKTEGLYANGSIAGSLLLSGYGVRMIRGFNDPNKYILQFWVGSYTGLNENGNPYNGLKDFQTTPDLLVESIEFDDIKDLIEWMKNDRTFDLYFELADSEVYGTGAVTDDDLNGYVGYNLATGGTEDYTADALDAAFEAIQEEGNTYFLADQWADEAQSVNNTEIFTHIQEEAFFEKFMFVGGGNNKQKLQGTNSTLETAAYYDSDRVIVVHSGIKVPKNNQKGFEEFSSIYNAAMSLGRVAGLEPQVPATYKDVKLYGLTHNATIPERKLMLRNGVWHIIRQDGAWKIHQAINTLQGSANTQLYNNDGSSHEHSIGRITAQLNKEIILAARQRPGFVGGNQFTASDNEVVEFTKSYLDSRTVAGSVDNLILGYQNVSVEAIQDAKFVKYQYVPNGPVNKFFFTGVVIPNL